MAQPAVTFIDADRIVELARTPRKVVARRLDRNETHVYRILSGTVGVSAYSIMRMYAMFGSIGIQMEGIRARLVPYDEPTAADTALTPAEVMWVLKQEANEAEAHMLGLLRAVERNDLEGIVQGLEQVLCDPEHAQQLVRCSLARRMGEGFLVALRLAQERHDTKVQTRYAA